MFRSIVLQNSQILGLAPPPTPLIPPNRRRNLKNPSAGPQARKFENRFSMFPKPTTEIEKRVSTPPKPELKIQLSISEHQFRKIWKRGRGRSGARSGARSGVSTPPKTRIENSFVDFRTPISENLEAKLAFRTCMCR